MSDEAKIACGSRMNDMFVKEWDKASDATSKCLYCDEKTQIRDGCEKQRWEVCRWHMATTCPKCGYYAPFLKSDLSGKYGYYCFRATPWCNWHSESPPEKHHQNWES